jgi:hypothetical protein
MRRIVGVIEYEPTSWCVVFNARPHPGWAKWVPGRFKHVRAYAFIPATRTWLFYDVNFPAPNSWRSPTGPTRARRSGRSSGRPAVLDVISVPRLPPGAAGFRGRTGAPRRCGIC